MLFDDNTGPIRDLSWLDPEGKLRDAWKKFVEDEIAAHGQYKPKRMNQGLGPISVNFTSDGPIEYCHIPHFRLLKYRILSGQWQLPERTGCSPDRRDYKSPEGTRWAVEIAFGYLGYKTPYTDSFDVWDVPYPWESKK